MSMVKPDPDRKWVIQAPTECLAASAGITGAALQYTKSHKGRLWKAADVHRFDRDTGLVEVYDGAKPVKDWSDGGIPLSAITHVPRGVE